MIILARHGETPANAAREAGSSESRVQGFSKDMPLSERGKIQAVAFGRALTRFIAGDTDVVVHSSDAMRAEYTRDLALAQLAPRIGRVTLMEPDTRLRELSKGSLEGSLREEAYPTEEIRRRQKIDWHFRHGTPESGGETAYEAGSRWLEWQQEVERSDARVVAFGHNLVTSFGIEMLIHPKQIELDTAVSLEQSTDYKVPNATALVIDKQEGVWRVIDRIVPKSEDYVIAKEVHHG